MSAAALRTIGLAEAIASAVVLAVELAYSVWPPIVGPAGIALGGWMIGLASAKARLERAPRDLDEDRQRRLDHGLVQMKLYSDVGRDVLAVPSGTRARAGGLDG